MIICKLELRKYFLKRKIIFQKKNISSKNFFEGGQALSDGYTRVVNLKDLHHSLIPCLNKNKLVPVFQRLNCFHEQYLLQISHKISNK